MPEFPPGVPWPPTPGDWLEALEQGADMPAAAYVHVPFCTVRCGYCDFNTYTKDFGAGANIATYADSVVEEIRYSKHALGEARTPLRSIFFGGGTPTLLAAESLGKITTSLAETFGIAENAEITVEANPETLTEEKVQRLADAGVNRLSVGMQSADPHVLRVLDRQHRPSQVPLVLEWAKSSGMQVSVDLIYGAPTETVSQWVRTLEEALSYEPDHVSAYSLIVEPGTKLAAQIARGDVEAPDEELAAEKYRITDHLLAEANMRWYEISNFAKVLDEEVSTAGDELVNASQHNLAYWQDWNWWGYGPGAHSHWGNLRWWNVKHPTAYAGRVGAKKSPGYAGEQLDASTRHLEKVMLGLRTAQGLEAAPELEGTERLVREGMLNAESLEKGRIVLTLDGRLFADYVTRVLLGWGD